MAAIGADAPIGSLFSPVHRYVSLDWHHLHQNIDGVREFFWAVRPLEFVPLAGLLAIGRRSWPKAVLVFGWFITFLVIKGTDDKANIEDASFFRLLMPSFPAFLLLLASIPLLVPAFSWSRRVLPNPLPALPTRRAGRRTLAAAAAVLVVLPLLFVAGTTPQSTAEAVSYPFQDVYVPVRDFGLKAANVGGQAGADLERPLLGEDRGLLHDPPLPAGRAGSLVERRPQGDRRRRVPRPPERRPAELPPVHGPPLERPAAAVHRPGAAGTLDVPRRNDRELEERPLAGGHHGRQHAGQGQRRVAMSGSVTLAYRLAVAGGVARVRLGDDALVLVAADDRPALRLRRPGVRDDREGGAGLPGRGRCRRSTPNRFVPHYLVGLVSDAFHVGDRPRVLRLRVPAPARPISVCSTA